MNIQLRDWLQKEIERLRNSFTTEPNVPAWEVKKYYRYRSILNWFSVKNELR